MSREVQTLYVAEDEHDIRLDRWFKRRWPHLTHIQVEKMARKGEIRVDGSRVKPQDRLTAGAAVRVPPLPEANPRKPGELHELSERDVAYAKSLVLYEDDMVIALNKPHGLAVQGGTKTTKHVDRLLSAWGEGMDRPRLVHRLDRDTSGVLLLARTRAAAMGLTRAFRSRDTRKIYWAAVAGVPHPAMGTIRFGLVKAAGHGAKGEAEKMRCIHPDLVDQTPDAKRAVTDYAVLSGLGGRCAWVAMVPVTGRTHQLRAHMAEIGHPIIGDGKYGGSGQENLGSGWGAQLGGEISRKLHLHARQIALTHPVTGARLTITAPLPPHMARTWASFDWRAGDVPEDPFEDEA